MINDLSMIRQEGLKALSNKLGAAGTIIFMRQFESGYGDYTKERENSLKDTSIDDIVLSINNRKKEN